VSKQWELHWRKSEMHGLLPDPEPRPIRYTLISVDDHLVEPPDMFEGRLPSRLQDLAPKVVETVEGHEVWEFDGQIYFQVGLNAVVGRAREDWRMEPTRFEDMRLGCYDIDARIADMDINGSWASVNFPSQITGFCGSVFSRCSDPELGLAVTQAWNDWFFEEWHSRHPTRIVPLHRLDDPGRAVLERPRQPAFEHVGRLDEVVVDRDQRVADRPGVGVREQPVGRALPPVQLPLRVPPGLGHGARLRRVAGAPARSGRRSARR
jgi:hypothetical protein